MPEQLSGIDEKMTAIREISDGKELKMSLERKIDEKKLREMVLDFVETDFKYREPWNEKSEKDPKGFLSINLKVIEGLKGTNIKPEKFIEKACTKAILRVSDLAFYEEDICERFTRHYGVKITLEDMSPESKQEIRKAMEERLEFFIKDHTRNSEKANPEYPLGVINILIEAGIMNEKDKDNFFQMAMDELCSIHRSAIFQKRKEKE